MRGAGCKTCTLHPASICLWSLCLLRLPQELLQSQHSALQALSILPWASEEAWKLASGLVSAALSKGISKLQSG